ncbi:protein eva-1-like [Dreissena polymorpha]|uniref:protein eva-1-like n=1 Tax=Dreissena polymorpha TaxID=45954 RepID=UPI002263B8B2|nr:protein eva-1-like [Dreissena polymorpha]
MPQIAGYGRVLLILLLYSVLVDHRVDSNSGILSGTLTTFEEASCDGEPMTMSCPPGMLVSIQFAQYGRQVPSSKMCPREEQSDDPNSGKSWISNMLPEDTNCLATTSLKVILEACQDRQHCHLVASSKTFQQDPCPGTRKYLEVAYKCRPNEFFSETVCEGDQLELRCSQSTRIAISTGIFGRANVGDLKCPELLRNTSATKTTCRSKTAVDELVRLCHGKKRCMLHAEEYVFGNPCPTGVNKYLNVVYTCVPKQVLKRHSIHTKRKKQKGEGSEVETNDNSPSLIHLSTTHNKVPSHTTMIQTDIFPADAAPNDSYGFPQGPGNPVLGESKETQGTKTGPKYDISSKDNKLEPGKTTPCTNTSSSREPQGPSATRLLTDWLNAFNFIIENKEKAVLYLVLGVTFGVISLLFLVIIRLAIINKRKSRAKLDVSEPAHENHAAPSNHIEAPTLERTESVDRIEVVRFNPMRSRDFATCTLRSDIGDRSLTNYYG